MSLPTTSDNKPTTNLLVALAADNKKTLSLRGRFFVVAAAVLFSLRFFGYLGGTALLTC